MNVLVTGGKGFIGRNLTAHLNACGCAVMPLDIENTRGELRQALDQAEIVYHLAGANRPLTNEEFELVNAGFTGEICATLRELGRTPMIVMSSSIQAELDNPYGTSKRRGEDALRQFAKETGAPVRIYRLKNVFGKWCRPNYNSVVATFCHNIANDLPIDVSDPDREIELVYIDDVIRAFLDELPTHGRSDGDHVIPSSRLTLGALAGLIQSFRDMHANFLIPNFSVRFNQQLYATYLSYVTPDDRCHRLRLKTDARGGLAEFIKSTSFGQIFISRTRAGITRGNHYHHTKTEKFLVVEGEGVIRMRQIGTPEVWEYRVRGEDYQVIDIPPGHTHSIENVGSSDMVTLFWASEIFDPDRSDTYYLPVLMPAENRNLVIA